jgi:hypothetical protein
LLQPALNSIAAVRHVIIAARFRSLKIILILAESGSAAIREDIIMKTPGDADAQRTNARQSGP